jgi:peptidoglycan L-alanyl-D-glutamate endopeptidase CwlK
MGAIEITTQDFGFLKNGGTRTAEEQRALWMQGRNGNPGKIVTDKDGYDNKSEHQIREDGYGYAGDAVPWHTGAPSWNWEFVFPVIKAIGTVAREQGASLRWGGVWDRKLEELNLDDLEGEVHAYTVRHPGPDHIDGPHIEYLGKIAPVKTSAKK